MRAEDIYYSTQNIQIAAFLYTHNSLKFVGIDDSNKAKVFFLFEPKDKADQLVSGYFAGTAKCSPRELFACFSDLKDLIFSGGQ